ncbi:MAG: hypothetical protein ACF8MF_06550, partial [Phycisphaerales bacterium JB052]
MERDTIFDPRRVLFNLPAIAFAFHDEPTSEPDGTEAPAEPTTPAEPVDEPTTLTQEQVNRIVQER